MNLQDLKKPFPTSAIKWRVGQKRKDGKKALMLCYVDARTVQDRLDEVCGIDGWSSSFSEVLGRIVCTITINGVSKSDGADDTNFEAAKGGLSDAFKRAAVQWGVARYLYNADKFNTWADITNCKGDWDIYPQNKEQLDKVAKALGEGKEPKQEPKAEPKKEQIDWKKRYDGCIKYLRNAKVLTYADDEKIINTACEIGLALKNNGEPEKAQEIENLLKEKIDLGEEK